MTFSRTARIVGAFCLMVAATEARADEPGVASVKVPRPITGEQVYRSVCQGCHMPDAKGATGAATIPALAKNPAVSSGEYLVTMINQGRGAMPSLGDLLDASQIAAVTTYIRTHFGNNYRKPVTPDEVRRITAAGH